MSTEVSRKLARKRKRQKNRSIIITVIILFYFIRFANSWQGLCNCMTQLLRARNSPFPYERPPQRGLRPPLFANSVCYLMSHRIDLYKGCETGPTIYRPYPRRLGSLTVCRCLIKEALSPKLF